MSESTDRNVEAYRNGPSAGDFGLHSKAGCGFPVLDGRETLSIRILIPDVHGSLPNV